MTGLENNNFFENQVDKFDELLEAEKKDWFLPSKDELNLMYKNLYKNGVGGFAGYPYWSSSEGSANYAWNQYFGTGGQTSNGEDLTSRVRAVRAFNN